jgi:3'(2'), 5'-bisphosphate nucleotidase
VPSLDQAACAALMDDLTRIAVQAGQTILDLAVSPSVRTKADGSPVTAADEAAEAVVCEGLRRLAPAVPIISEERASRERPKAAPSGSYFLVDPIDGTREFLAGRDEYSLNIAIVTDAAPMLGLILAPSRRRLWRGLIGRGAERLDLTDGEKGLSQRHPIHTRPSPHAEPAVVVSRSHLDPRTQAYVQSLPQAKLVQSGSAVKFCLVAEGAADLYPRLAPTRDWDVAAGHAILAAAGGKVVAPDGGRIVYGSAELKIPGFLAWGDPKRATGLKG